MSILIDGIFEQKANNEGIRKRLYRIAEDKGALYLYKKLESIDPEAAKKIHPHDAKRIIRALEVFEANGKPISVLQKERKGLKDDYDIKIFCLNMKRDELYQKINKRVERMNEQGLLREVKGLLNKRLSKTAGCAIGIKELKCYLDGKCGFEEAKHLMQRNSRRYAKRQLTWFRKDKRIRWIQIKDEETPQSVASRINRIISVK